MAAQLRSVVRLSLLDQISRSVEPMDRSFNKACEELTYPRISSRDVEDWPLVAAFLLLDCPIWTEDLDFFGSRVATWTTDKFKLYLRDA